MEPKKAIELAWKRYKSGKWKYNHRRLKSNTFMSFTGHIVDVLRKLLDLDEWKEGKNEGGIDYSIGGFYVYVPGAVEKYLKKSYADLYRKEATLGPEKFKDWLLETLA